MTTLRVPPFVPLAGERELYAWPAPRVVVGRLGETGTVVLRLVLAQGGYTDVDFKDETAAEAAVLEARALHQAMETFWAHCKAMSVGQPCPVCRGDWGP